MRRIVQLIGVVFIVTILQVNSDENFDKLFSAGKYKEALDYAEQQIPPAGRNADIWIKIATANEKLGLSEKALASYMVCWRLNPKSYESPLGAARIYNKLGQPERAVDFAQKALDINFTAEASWEYAQACISLKKPSEAKKALEKIIEADPANIIANRELGTIYYTDKQYDKALPLLKTSYATKAEPRLAFQIGKACIETNNSDGAIDFLKKALALNSDFTDAKLELARAYYNNKNYADAADLYSKIPSKTALGALDYYRMAISLENLNKKQESINAYTSAAEKFGNSREKEALRCRYVIGNNHLEKKNYSAALTQLEFITAADPKASIFKDSYFLLSDAYLGMANQTKAIESLEKSIALNASNIEAYARLADLYTRNNMADKAKATYEKMMSLSPNDPNVYLILGEYNLKAGKNDKALELFEKSNTLAKSAATLEGISIAASSLNQWQKAQDAAESALTLDENRMRARVVLAQSFMRDKNYTEAKKHLEFLIKKEPLNIKYWQDLASCYEALDDTNSLSSADAKINSLDKSNTKSRLRQANYLMNHGDRDNAYPLFLELATLTPNSPSVFKNLYKISMAKNDKANGTEYLKKYLTLNQNDAEAQRDLGDLLYEKKDLDGALSAYRLAIKIDPTIKGFYKRYADIVIAKGQQDEVIKALTGVIKSGDADVGTYSTLGTIYLKKGIYKEALEMYQKALTFDPQNFDALASLGECQVKTGNTRDAVITYEQAIMLNPKADKEYKALGDLYLKQKNVEQALTLYLKYLEKVPDDQEITKFIGDYNYGKGDYKTALKYLTNVKGELAQSSDHLLKMADSYVKTESFKDAVRIFNILLTRNPGPEMSKKILRSKAELLEKQNDTAGLIATYDALLKLKGVNDPDVSYNRALYREKKDPVLAQKIYEVNLKVYPADYRNYLRLGLLYSKIPATLARAASMLEIAASKAGKDKTVWLEIAKVYGQLGNEAKELSAYRKYIEADPQNLDANIRIGSILVAKNNFSEGLIYLETANTLSPNNIKIMVPLAKGYLATNRDKEALSILKKAKELKPDDPEIRKSLYKTYLKVGEKKAAADEIKELVKTSKDQGLLLLYAGLLLEDGKLKEAQDAIEDIRAVNPENIEALMLLAKVQRANKKYDDAIETYKEVLYINANYAPALYERAETHMLQNKPQWAEKFYDRAIRTDPKMGVAELGLAKVFRLRKDNAGYVEHLKKAQQISPDNPEIKAECKQAGL